MQFLRVFFDSKKNLHVQCKCCKMCALINSKKRSMTNLTIRIDDLLKKQAMQQAKQLGVPLSLVIKNALKNFVCNPKVVIGDVENVEVNESLQKKMDKIGSFLSTK